MDRWDARLDPNTNQVLRAADTAAEAGPSSAPIAPLVPDGIDNQARRKAAQLDRRIRATITDPTMNPAEQLRAWADDWQSTVQDSESPLTKKHREQSLSDWAGYLIVVEPNLPKDDHWARATVKSHAAKFLYSKVKTTPPRANKKVLKARTLTWWTGLLLHSIVTYTRDSTGHKCGISLLVTDGLYKEIKNAILKLIRDFKLDRHGNKRIYFGRTELQMILEKYLDSTEHEGRQVCVQHMNAYLVTFYFSSRASSLGPTHEMWREMDYEPLLRDLTILCFGRLNWEIDVDFLHYKTAINTAVGQKQTFRISGVSKAHNALFDLTVTLMAHLYMMEAFETKYKASVSLIFRKATSKGRQFVEPPIAAKAQSFYTSLRYWAGKAGLPRAGYTALRRDTGNMFALQLGAKLAKDILNHHVQGVFRGSYSKNMQNLKLVGIRLGEVAGRKEGAPGEQLKEHDNMHLFASYAVEALVRADIQDPEAVKSEQDAARRTFRDSLKDKEPIKTLHESRVAAWDVYIKCFSATAKGYVMSTANANKIFKRATGELKLKHEDSNPLVFQDPWTKINTEPARKAFLDAEKSFLAKQKELLRRYDEDDKNTKNWDILSSPLSGTPEERRKMVETLMKEQPSRHIKQAVDDAMGRIAPPASLQDAAAVRTWASNLRDASAATAVQEYDNDEDAQEEAGDQDKLFAFFDRLSFDDPSPDLASPVAIDNVTANVTPADDDDEPEEPLEPLENRPDVQESDEADVLDIPITDMREAMFLYLVQPVVTARSYAKYKQQHEDGKEEYKCPRCALYTHLDPVPEAAFPTIAKFNRHILSTHSEWADLELEMVDAESGTFHCPAGDLTLAKTVEQVRDHALDDCVNAVAYRRLVQEAKDATPATTDNRSFRHRRHGKSNVANDVHRFEEDDSEDDGAQETAIDAKSRTKRLLAAAADRTDSEDAATVGQNLIRYIDETDGDIPQLPQNSKGVKQAEWDALGLDPW
ncbi:hypothetical protein DFH06DRAFT_1291313 [Mycena polygramma]|nr:hypothetical protein DFH06DRAFT_1291313 [Mycena polygramma]